MPASDAAATAAIGQRFGSWRVLGLAKPRGAHAYVLAMCDCLLLREIAFGSLRAGQSKSCHPCALRRINRTKITDADALQTPKSWNENSITKIQRHVFRIKYEPYHNGGRVFARCYVWERGIQSF